jgi:hypothetical protein
MRLKITYGRRKLRMGENKLRMGEEITYERIKLRMRE